MGAGAGASRRGRASAALGEGEGAEADVVLATDRRQVMDQRRLVVLLRDRGAERDEIGVVAREVAARLLGGGDLHLSGRDLPVQAVDAVLELARLLLLRSQDQQPEPDREGDQRQGDQDDSFASLHVSLPGSGWLRSWPAGRHWRRPAWSPRSAPRPPARHRPRPPSRSSSVEVSVVVSGAGGRNRAVGGGHHDLVEGGDQVELGDAGAGLAVVRGPGRARRMAVSGFAESLAVTRVTPSMSFMAATRLATSSWLRPQPVSTSAGPGIDARSPPSSAAVADLDVRSHGPGQADQPDVAGKHLRELTQHPLPVEAALCELLDGLDAGIVDLLEGDERGEAVGAGLELGGVRLDPGGLGLAVGDLLVEDDDSADGRQRRRRARRR